MYRYEKEMLDNLKIIENYVAIMNERMWYWIYREIYNDETKNICFMDWTEIYCYNEEISHDFFSKLPKEKFNREKFIIMHNKFANWEKRKTKPKKLVELEKWYNETKKFGRIVLDFN